MSLSSLPGGLWLLGQILDSYALVPAYLPCFPGEPYEQASAMIPVMKGASTCLPHSDESKLSNHQP